MLLFPWPKHSTSAKWKKIVELETLHRHSEDTQTFKAHWVPSGTWVLGRHSSTWKVLITRALRRHLRHLGTRTLRALRPLGIYAQVTRAVKALGHSETWTLEALYLADLLNVFLFLLLLLYLVFLQYLTVLQ